MKVEVDDAFKESIAQNMTQFSLCVGKGQKNRQPECWYIVLCSTCQFFALLVTHKGGLVSSNNFNRLDVASAPRLRLILGSLVAISAEKRNMTRKAHSINVGIANMSSCPAPQIVDFIDLAVSPLTCTF